VEPGAKVRLAKIDASYTGKHETHENALPEIQKHVERMDKLQYPLYADGNQSLLVVLQALDAAGKDGTLRHVFSGMNPQGTFVYGFKQPSREEAAHDFLWRAHQRTPGKGEVVVFNRSHYEDVLVVAVQGADASEACPSHANMDAMLVSLWSVSLLRHFGRPAQLLRARDDSNIRPLMPPEDSSSAVFCTARRQHRARPAHRFVVKRIIRFS
jgi:hypothetical protein